MKRTSIPAIPFMKAVRQWAASNGIPFVTLKQQIKATSAYINFEAKKN